MLTLLQLLAGIWIGGLMVMAPLVRWAFPHYPLSVVLVAGGMWPLFVGWLLAGSDG